MAELFPSINIGKFFGVPIQLHWTFVLLLLLSLFLGPFIFVFVVLLFTMVTIHELAHSVTAMRSGIAVKKIILIPLGGASIINLEGIPPNTSFRIALAGPLTSVLLAMVFGVLVVITPPATLYTTLAYIFGFNVSLNEILQLLFALNLLLGVFNMLPAFPLDGGRVLKSYLQRRRNELDATKLAVKVSKIMLVVFIVILTIYATLVAPIGSADWDFIMLWDLLLVVFIYGGAQGELESAYIKKYTSSLHVYDAVSGNYAMVKPDTTLKDVYQILISEKTHIVLFKKGTTLNIVSKIPVNPFGKGPEILDKKVSDFGTVIPTIDYNATLSKALERMRYEDATVLAVMKRGKLAGVLLSQHVESVIALHLPHTVQEEKKNESGV